MSLEGRSEGKSATSPFIAQKITNPALLHSLHRTEFTNAAHLVKFNTSSVFAAYPINGMVGHCFMRVCMLVDLFASWTRRSHPHTQWNAALVEATRTTTTDVSGNAPGKAIPKAQSAHLA